MCAFAVCLVCVSLLLRTSLGCFRCLIDISDSLKLCWGHVWGEFDVRNVDSCFRKVDRIFTNDDRLIEAGRVGEGYDKELKDIMNAEIMPMLKEFDEKENKGSVYEERFQKAADNFIAAASKLPRVTGCVPPCGFQIAGAVYNCLTCKYDSCEFPLDCPVKEVKAIESSSTEMWCKVPFNLPDDIEVVWRVAKEVKTQQVNEFKEVTAGLDRLYSIPSTSFEHRGTYQCEIYTGNRSIVRLYFYLSVTRQVLTGHTDLQDLFDLSLLPGGRLLPPPRSTPPSVLLPLPLLLTACLTTSLVLLYLSLGVLYKDERNEADEDAEEMHIVQ